jgi:hypothetical protein
VFTLNLFKGGVIAAQTAGGERVPPRATFWNFGLLICEQRLIHIVNLHFDLAYV